MNTYKVTVTVSMKHAEYERTDTVRALCPEHAAQITARRFRFRRFHKIERITETQAAAK